MPISEKVRVRFAPSPTGLMHLGNIRTALLNYLFAQHNKGTFVLRIEDTDPKRNFDPGAHKIRADLAWLDLHYDEGPGVGGLFAPYVQSERLGLYQAQLNKLIEINAVYRCFCTSDELEKRRARQLALKQPPRYDRRCLQLTNDEIANKHAKNAPFIWRFKLDHSKSIVISDLARGKVTFELKHFSDIPITRHDGTFTFMFANCVDDIAMQITHVFRGEDHLSNTAGQAALYQAFETPLPVFWHMPILCNIEGKKLSKRDFGFSLNDLKAEGYVPEAICNYLAIIGGGSFEHEIMDLSELAKTLDLCASASSGQVKYDVEKLNWINHEWIKRLDPTTLAQRVRPVLESAYPAATDLSEQKLLQLTVMIQKELYTLQDATRLTAFYFNDPEQLVVQQKQAMIPEPMLILLQASVETLCQHLHNPNEFVDQLKTLCKASDIPLKYGYWFIRILLTGSHQGPSIQELLTLLEPERVKQRFGCS